MNASVAALMSILSRLSVVESFLMISLNRFSQSVSVFVFNLRFRICCMSCRITLASSHESTNPNVSASNLGITVVFDLKPLKSIIDACLL